MSDIHRDPRQAAALRELRGRGEIQQCWSCGKTLLASARKPHPQAITVGHYVDVDLGLTNPYDPSQCGPDGQIIPNASKGFLEVTRGII